MSTKTVAFLSQDSIRKKIGVKFSTGKQRGISKLVVVKCRDSPR